MKALDAGAGVLVFEQAGYIHELDPGNERARVVNITATGDFPWMMPQWKDVSNRMTNLALVGRRASARRSRRAARSSRSRPRRVTSATSRTRVGRRRSRRHGHPTDARSRTSATSPASTSSTSQPQDGLTPPREITLPEPSRFFYTPAWSPNGASIAFQDTHFSSGWSTWPAATRPSRRRRPVLQRRSLHRPGVEPRLALHRLSEAPAIALPRALPVRRGDRREDADHRRPVGRDVAGVGRERQVSVVLRVDELRAQLVGAGHVGVRARRTRAGST